jgi:sulfoxide reductase catalytic subunit YedY
VIKKYKHSEITPELIYSKRRKFIKSIGLGVGSVSLSSIPFLNTAYSQNKTELTSYEDITSYNNYYEFGTGKGDPFKNSQEFVTKPWSVTIEGEVDNPITLSAEEIISLFPSEERVYKLRCVEGWSMVIPWMGFSLSKLESIYDPLQMKGQKYPVLNWPYREGLRIDEAMHPITTVVTGLYGKSLPNQNGAPLRIFVPWKYGFKSAKAIVKIKLVENMPTSSWMRSSPREYGFYSNVNPKVSHPRWSQATERVIGEGILSPRIETEMFNGYGDEVANLYSGMDLKINF